MPDPYDRLLGQFDGLPDICKTRQSIVRVMPPFGVGGSETFICQTVRQRGADKEPSKEWIFVEYVTREKAIRLVFPPEVSSLIQRQHDQLTTVNRKRGARQAVQTRAERGIQPGFLKKGRK